MELKYTIGTLFSGCGGVEMGVKRVGFEPIWGVEKDTTIAKVHQLNWNAEVLNCDIRTIDDEIIHLLDVPDLLWASPPCQEYSKARTTAGAENETHAEADAGREVCRFIDIMRPRWFGLENVTGYGRAGSPLADIIRTLLSCGYDVRWQIVCASLFGIPQERRRLLLWADRSAKVGSIRSQYGRREVSIKDVLADSDVEPYPMPAYIRKGLFTECDESFQSPQLKPEHKKRLDAGDVIIDSSYLNYDSKKKALIIRSVDRPLFTLTKSHAGSGIFRYCWRGSRANSRFERLTLQGFMKVQGFDADLSWGSVANGKRRGMIGDSVPPALSEAVARVLTSQNDNSFCAER